MHRQSFDAIYANVPAAQVEELKQFRRTHPPKQLITNNVTGNTGHASSILKRDEVFSSIREFLQGVEKNE